MKHFFSLTLFSLCTLIAAAQTWEPMAPMPSGRHHPVTFALDGQGYSFTGSDALTGLSSDGYKYDPASDSWSTIASFPGAPRSFAIGYAYNGKGYLGFGLNNFGAQRDIWEFDPSSETWELVTLCPCSPRRHPAFLIKDDKIYIGLGDNAVSADLNDWWVYDMNADTWTQLQSLPALARHHPFHFIADSTIYAGFGHGGPVIYDDWYSYDPDANSWQTMSDFPGEARVAGTQFDHGGYGYVLSGDGSDHWFMNQGEFWQYDAVADAWTQLTSHPGISRWAPGSFVIEDTVYFMGGENRQTGNIESSAWKYTLPAPPEDTTSTDTTVVDTIPPAGIRDITQENLKLFPVPAQNVLHVQSDFTIESIQIVSITGQQVFYRQGHVRMIEVNSLPAGIYVAQIRSESGNVHTLRWMKR